ncbi:hypothetical protein [Rummeliibacillus sp. SL167]|uniref:hypothetical protein n=1 Tax=Rummeliibacillus sp. SL167 TaxID=2579792 RepID=UPI0011B64661|nr:hypothetical protein [Rummeliibacillus sp. SL167]
MGFKDEFMKIDDAVKLLDLLKEAQPKGLVDKEMIRHFNEACKKQTVGQTPEKHDNPYSLARIRKKQNP